MLFREKEKLLTTQRECVAQQKRGDDALAALEESRLQAQLLRETNSRSELAIKEKEQVCSILLLYRLLVLTEVKLMGFIFDYDHHQNTHQSSYI